MRRLLVTIALVIVGSASWAQDTSNQDEPEAEAIPEVRAEEPMNLDRLVALVRAIDPEAIVNGNAMELTIEDIPILVVTDPVANRMRAMVPIRSAEGLQADELMRLMQANFDSALDARYAVAQGRLWGVFIHPLSELERDQFLSALIQTVNVARTYGSTYSGGAMTFGGGDSNGIFRDLFEELKELGEEI
ncbi:MAG: hypothetical protein ABJN14_08885 [Paracoccaceae bacterium]